MERSVKRLLQWYQQKMQVPWNELVGSGGCDGQRTGLFKFIYWMWGNKGTGGIKDNYQILELEQLGTNKCPVLDGETSERGKPRGRNEGFLQL